MGFFQEWGDFHPFCDDLSAGVAYIVLKNIQNKLPQWAAYSEDKGVVTSREYKEKNLLGISKLQMIPQLLFSINWASSGPGYSWPETYYLTWVPLFERFVVTASVDDKSMYGEISTDQAIGKFEKKDKILDSVKDVITGWWSCWVVEYQQERWESVLQEGIISEEEANNWSKDSEWGEN